VGKVGALHTSAARNKREKNRLTRKEHYGRSSVQWE
jgi:hypothetical protein